MKIYKLSFNANQPVTQQINVPTGNEYALGIKVQRDGKEVNCGLDEISVDCLSATTQTANYNIFKLSADNVPGLRELDVKVDKAATANVQMSSVQTYNITSRGGSVGVKGIYLSAYNLPETLTLRYDDVEILPAQYSISSASGWSEVKTLPYNTSNWGNGIFRIVCDGVDYIKWPTHWVSQSQKLEYITIDTAASEIKSTMHTIRPGVAGTAYMSSYVNINTHDALDAKFKILAQQQDSGYIEVEEEQSSLTEAQRSAIESISAKADVVSLSAYQGKLADAQISAVNSVVSAMEAEQNEKYTTITFEDGTVSSFVWPETVDWNYLLEEGLADEENYTWFKQPVEAKIGNTIKILGDSVFSNCQMLSNATLPNSLTEIGGFTFADDTSLSSIDFPDSVQFIGEMAFENTPLTGVTFPDSIQHIGGFDGCVNLASVRIPDSVGEIEAGAFANDTNLTSLTIGNSVSAIGRQAFDGCARLHSIVIPSSVVAIGVDAFKEATTSLVGGTSSNLTCVLFEGKSMSEVSAMANYPWGITDTNIIATKNDVTKEWIQNQMSNLSVDNLTLSGVSHAPVWQTITIDGTSYTVLVASAE